MKEFATNCCALVCSAIGAKMPIRDDSSGSQKECADSPMLASEIPEGTGRCIPAVEPHADADRAACGPFRKRPPEKVTSETTFGLAPVDANSLKARLVFNAVNHPPVSQNVLCFKRPTPSQIRKDALSRVPPLEPLVSRIMSLLHLSCPNCL